MNVLLNEELIVHLFVKVYDKIFHVPKIWQNERLQLKKYYKFCRKVTIIITNKSGHLKSPH
jgi:hypothetical protein